MIYDYTITTGKGEALNLDGKRDKGLKHTDFFIHPVAFPQHCGYILGVVGAVVHHGNQDSFDL